MERKNEVEIWGGIECTINRVKDQYFDQSEYSGHYERGVEDIDLVASLGIKLLRYPVLWEKHFPQPDSIPDWCFVEKTLERMQEKGITPIAGLVHHGSGPKWVNFFDGSFEKGVEAYAYTVAEKFPWLEYYTPINEPLTTARFCGLYGHWYPHKNDYYHFFKILLSECKATVLAMNAVRKINPAAKLIQTEDLGKCHSTPLLQYQADLENERRWLSYDLLCGALTPDKVMYRYMLEKGITEEELNWFLENPCKPHVAGFNYYLTSERYLDEDMQTYPTEFHGGNDLHNYADIHTVHVPMEGKACGPYTLLKEAWERLQVPLAITECHLHSTREDQMRWFHTMWGTVNQLKKDGVDIRAITAWAIFGLTGWNRLVTQPGGDYEPGVFNVSCGYPKPTALAGLLRELTQSNRYYHPVLEHEGWWQRKDRLLYAKNKVLQMNRRNKKPSCRPLLILGKTGTLGGAFSQVCDERNIYHELLNRKDLDITDPHSIAEVIKELNPWGLVNATGYVKLDEAEKEEESCWKVNSEGPAMLAAACHKYAVRFLSYSTDLVFNGRQDTPYVESSAVSPLNIYGKSKVAAEQTILQHNPEAVIVRTSSFFSPWDRYNFVYATLRDLKERKQVVVADDVYISPTYVPDLVHTSLDLLLDGDKGIFHVTNKGTTTWSDFARQVALLAGLDEELIKGVPLASLRLQAKRPYYSVLQSEKGLVLPSLENALERYLEATGIEYASSKIAV